MMHSKLVVPLVSLLMVVACSSTSERADSTPTEQARESRAADEANETGGAADLSDEGDQEEEQPRTVAVTDEPVTFSSGELTLTGEIVRPDETNEPTRGVVIVHDVGPMGRDGMIGDLFGVQLPVEVPVYRLLAESLASRGYVVLVYDKRTCVKGSSPWCNYPRDFVEQRDDLAGALVSDAVAAGEFLASRDDVADVAFVGHGQGAEVALVAAHQTDAPLAVLLAPTAYGPDELVLHQTQQSMVLVRQRLEKIGDQPEADLLKKDLAELEKQAAMQREQFAQISKERHEASILGLPAATWRDLVDLHRRFLDLVRDTSIPVYAIMGDTDPGEPDDGPQRIEKLVGPHGAGAFILVPDLTRAMVAIGENDDPTVLSPVVAGHVADVLD